MRRSKKRRPRHNEEQWGEILRRFSTSQLSARDFCRREGLALSSFQRWRRRLGSASSAELVELVPALQATAQAVRLVARCSRFRMAYAFAFRGRRCSCRRLRNEFWRTTSRST